MDLAQNTLLYKVKNESLDIETKLEIMKTIFKTVARLHSMDLVHSDLKPSNIMITGQGIIKIIDFGFCVDKNILEKGFPEMGTKGYMGNEKLKSPRSIGCHNDMYSMAGIFLFVVTGIEPQIDNFDFVNFDYQNCPKSIKELIISLGNQEWKKRPTASQVCDILEKIEFTHE